MCFLYYYRLNEFNQDNCNYIVEVPEISVYVRELYVTVLVPYNCCNYNKALSP